MLLGNDVSTPFDPCVKLYKNKGATVSQLDYRRAIGCLMYIMSCIRPDIAYEVSILSRYTSNPSGEHWTAVIRVFKYLKRTIDYGLHYEKYPVVLEGYCDANWMSGSKESKSMYGYIFTCGNAAVSRKLKKQSCISPIYNGFRGCCHDITW